MENRNFDDNCIVVVNSHDETIGVIAKDFARYLAPLIDSSTGIFDGIVSKRQTYPFKEAYNIGEQCDLQVNIYAKDEGKIKELVIALKKFPLKYKVIFMKQEDDDCIEDTVRISRTNLKTWSSNDCDYYCIYKNEDGKICDKEKVRFADTYFSEVAIPKVKSRTYAEAILFRAEDSHIVQQIGNKKRSAAEGEIEEQPKRNLISDMKSEST